MHPCITEKDQKGVNILVIDQEIALNYTKLLGIIRDYLTKTPVYKVVFHAMMVTIVSTYLGGLYLIVTNFDTLAKMYQENIHRSPRFVEEIVDRNAQIQDVLDSVRDETFSDRSYLAKFHNGTTSIGGIPFLFSSIMVESVAFGVSQEVQSNQNIPISLLQPHMQRFGARECIVAGDVTRDFASLKVFFMRQGIRSFVACPVVNTKNALIGYVAIVYIKTPQSSLVLNSRLPVLREAAIRIGGILGTK